MRRMLVVKLVALGLITVSGLSAAPTPSQQAVGKPSAKPLVRPASPFVGTWKLVRFERRNSKGELLPAPKSPAGNPNPVGLMMYDPAGYMGLAVMQGGRQKFTGSEPTPAEAKAAVETFTSFFGTHAVDQAVGSVTFHVDGSLDPSLTNSSRRYSFERSGNQLTLRPPPTATGLQDTLLWERIPDLEKMTSTHRRLTGFWKLVPNEGEKSAPAVSNQDQRRGFIIYSASGQMAVHIMPAGRMRYAHEEPTPEEAEAALTGYTSYFGPYTVNEEERYVVHQRIAHTLPASVGTNAQRFYEFSGRRLILRLFSRTFTVPTTIQSAKSGGQESSMITWERISADVGSQEQNR